MVERKIGEVFTCMTGQLVMCVKSSEMSCRGCIYCNNGMCSYDKSTGGCSPRKRSDGNSVIFQAVITKPSLAKDISTLERIAKEYPGKTIENIIVQLKSRLNETKSHI